MMFINFMTPKEMQLKIAASARAKRLGLNMSQQSLSERSGVSYGVLKKFERTGQISLESLLKLAIILESMDSFHALFPLHKPESVLSIDQLLLDGVRKRGRK